MSDVGAEVLSEPQKTIKIKRQSKKKQKFTDIYTKSIITKSIIVNINIVDNKIEQTLEKIIAYNIEGKCISEGYIKPESIKIITYSSGIVKGSNVIFDVVFECLVCYLVEGMIINCIAKNITKAGIRAELSEENSPIIVFVARDHNYLSTKFSTIQDNDTIIIRVIGQRFELNDTYISIIGELISDTKS